MTNVEFYGQDQTYYKQVKQILEEIYVLMGGLTESDQRDFIERMSRHLEVCGPGVYTGLSDMLFELKIQQGIPSLLATLRKNILREIAEEHIDKENISDDYILKAVEF
jgi:hypothetical protein